MTILILTEKDVIIKQQFWIGKWKHGKRMHIHHDELTSLSAIAEGIKAARLPVPPISPIKGSLFLTSPKKRSGKKTESINAYKKAVHTELPYIIAFLDD